MTEKAREVYESVKPDEPPPPPPTDPPPDEGGGNDGDPQRLGFSSGALTVAIICLIGGGYLTYIGLRGMALELSRLKGGK